MQLAEVRSLTSFPSTLLGCLLHAQVPCRDMDPHASLEGLGRPEQLGEGCRDLFRKSGSAAVFKAEKRWHMEEAEDFGWDLLCCCWAFTTPFSQNNTRGTEPSRELEPRPSLGGWVWGYGSIGSFVLRWG